MGGGGAANAGGGEKGGRLEGGEGRQLEGGENGKLEGGGDQGGRGRDSHPGEREPGSAVYSQARPGGRLKKIVRCLLEARRIRAGGDGKHSDWTFQTKPGFDSQPKQRGKPAKFWGRG